MKLMVLKGKRFGFWVVTEDSGGGYKTCQCDCGVIQKKQTAELTKGRSTKCRSCSGGGGLKYGQKLHGMSKTKTYKSWKLAKSRCTSITNNRYSSYGGRGIKFCKRWLNSFEHFYSDMGDRPIGKTLGRIDNDGNYCKSNCRWETPKQQANNRRVRKIWWLNKACFMRKNGETFAAIGRVLNIDPSGIRRTLINRGKYDG